MNKTLNDELAELRALDRDQLVERYRAETGREPRQRNVTWLVRRLAWKAQERRLGGLSATARETLDRLIGEIELPTGEPKPKTGGVTKKKSTDVPVGTAFTRTWHDKEIRVTVVDGGFEHDGAIHKSLSAVAHAVTGSHWNGRLFFGLTARARAK